jgi:RHS repeat-associated protein
MFVDFYHHRDHLGTLRVVTDDAGAVVSLHDFYPFGIEMFDPAQGPQGETRMRYTMHERDAATGTDYMMARYKHGSHAGFLAPDPIYDVSPGAPTSWNKYDYVRGGPLNRTDRSGLMMALYCSTNPFDPVCTFGWTGSPFGGSSWPDNLDYCIRGNYVVNGELEQAEFCEDFGWAGAMWEWYDNRTVRGAPGRGGSDVKQPSSTPACPPMPPVAALPGETQDQALARVLQNIAISTGVGPTAAVIMVSPGSVWDYKRRFGGQSRLVAQDAGNFNAGAVLAPWFGTYGTQVGGGVASILYNGYRGAAGEGAPPFVFLPSVAPVPIAGAVFTGVAPYGDLNNSRNTAGQVAAGAEFYAWLECVGTSP